MPQDRLFRVSVQQPLLLPWAGFWNKVAAADRFILYAGVQYSHGDWFNRFKINDRWLTLPVAKGSTNLPIKDTRLAEGYERALDKMAATIQQTCMPKSAKYRDRLHTVVGLLQRWRSPFLLELSNSLFMLIFEALELGSLSKVVIDVSNPLLDRIAKLDDCLRRHAPDEPFVFLSGSGARSYMGFDDLKAPKETWFQQVDPSVSRNSVLQLIAACERPMDAIAGCARWADRSGQSFVL